jgi:hypothetical protein
MRDEFVEVLKNYCISKVVGDHYGGEFVKEPFRKHAIAYEVSKQVKSDLFRDLLPLLNSGRIRLPRHHRLVAQIVGLERRVSRGGKDSIGQPSHGHDDVANAVAGAAAAARQCTYDLSEFTTSHLNDLWLSPGAYTDVLPEVIHQTYQSPTQMRRCQDVVGFRGPGAHGYYFFAELAHGISPRALIDCQPKL